jgi:hypothetical protein
MRWIIRWNPVELHSRSSYTIDLFTSHHIFIPLNVSNYSDNYGDKKLLIAWNSDAHWRKNI